MDRSEVIETSDPGALPGVPVVSVLMSTYRHEAYLAQAIEGVVRQRTDFPFELLIGEDKSPDRTLAIALEYQARYPSIIRVIHSDTNVGAIANANRCVARTRGEFIAWCEGDDYWSDTSKLQRQVEFLRAHPDFSLVHSAYDHLVRLSGTWRIVPAHARRKQRLMVEETYDSLLRSMTVRTCTMMARGALLREHFASPLRAPEHVVGDRPIVLHLSRLGRIGYLDAPLATYRRAPGSQTNVGYAKLLRQVRLKHSKYANFARYFGATDQEALEMQRICYREDLGFAFLAVDPAEFAAASAWLKEHDPRWSAALGMRLRSLLIRAPSLLRLMLRVKDLRNECMLAWRAAPAPRRPGLFDGREAGFMDAGT